METICWLKITDYMQGWMRATLGGPERVKNDPVIHVHTLDGAGAVMMMTTDNEPSWMGVPGNVICDTWHAALSVGMEIDARGMQKELGITREVLAQYLPIACPKNALADDGSIHPWDSDTSFGKEQATALQRLLREAFWESVDNYSREYNKEHLGEKYAQIEMLEAFCKEYHTDDMYIQAMRREWQRRCQRAKDA